MATSTMSAQCTSALYSHSIVCLTYTYYTQIKEVVMTCPHIPKWPADTYHNVTVVTKPHNNIITRRRATVI